MKLTIASAQYPITAHLHWEDWLTCIESWIVSAVEQKADILLFPEYTGLELAGLLSKDFQKNIHKQVELLQKYLPDFLNTLDFLSQKHAIVLVFPGFPVYEQNKYINRVFVWGPHGYVGYQDKYFMTRFENESWHISSGVNSLHIFEYQSIKFGIQTCYDVEFALGSQILADYGVQMLLVPSCTETIRGATRVHIGARARALEQQMYVIVSQVIKDSPWNPIIDHNYGFSAFYTSPDLNMPEEGILAIGKPQEACWLIKTLDFEYIENIRLQGQVLNYIDHRKLKYHTNNEKFKIIQTYIEKIEK